MSDDCSADVLGIYNKIIMSKITQRFDDEELRAINLLALLFHCNAERTPGYISNRMPVGVKNYVPGADEMKSLREMNSYYEISEDDIEYVIEGIYIQHRFCNEEKYIWIIYSEGLSDDEVVLLGKKCKHIERWLKNKGIYHKICLTAEKTLSNKYYELNGSDIHLDKRFFLEQFYMESALLAGKKPCWLTDTNGLDGECIDLGWSANVRPQDYYSYAIWNVLNIYNNPVESWFNLVLVYCELMYGEKYTYIEELKLKISKNKISDIGSDPVKMYADYMCSRFQRLINGDGIESMQELIYLIYRHYKGNKDDRDNIYYYLNVMLGGESQKIYSGLNVTEYVRLVEIIYKQSISMFASMRNTMLSHNGGFLEPRSTVDSLSLRLLNNLDTNSAEYVYIKLRENYVDILSRVIIEKGGFKDKEKWSLKTYTDDGVLLLVKLENSLVELIIWAYLNGMVDSSTQVSVRESDADMDSLDICEFVKYLENNISTSQYKKLGLNIFVDQKHAVQAFLFTSYDSKAELDTAPVIYQLVIYNTGEYRVNVYHGYEGYIGCVYNWNDVVKHSKATEVPRLQFHSLKAGAEIMVADDINKLMHEFKSNLMLSNSRTILKQNNKYYVSQISRNNHKSYCFENVYEFYKYMEQPLESYTSCAFSGCFDVDERLSYLMKQNRRDVVQLFYYLDGKHVISYVFDENGALVVFRQLILNRQCYINNWVEFLNNSVSRVNKNIKLEIAQLLTLDSVSYEHILLTGDYVSSDIRYLGIKLDICTRDNKIDLVFELPEESYSMSQHGSRLYQKISDYIKFEKRNDEIVPVYITDIDIMCESGECLDKQTGGKLIHFLQYKKNVESQLNKKIYKLH